MRRLLSKEAKNNANNIVKGTTPSVNKHVLTNACQKIGSESILL